MCVMTLALASRSGNPDCNNSKSTSMGANSLEKISAEQSPEPTTKLLKR